MEVTKLCRKPSATIKFFIFPLVTTVVRIDSGNFGTCFYRIYEHSITATVGSVLRQHSPSGSPGVT